MKHAAACALCGLIAIAPAGAGTLQLEPFTVTANRTATPLAESVFGITRLSSEELDLVGATHPNELFTRVPGSWISRGSGQEHLTAIRSPVLTGAGACGAFLYLEDGIPVRPAGFCNVNQLFEMNTEQADAIEVLRGPGSVLHGSNALHGVINILHTPLRLPTNEVAASVGEYGLRRVSLDHSDVTLSGGWRAKYFGETADSIQRDAGHEQHKLNLGWHGDYWRAHVAATSLDQDSAGYILGEAAYRDPAINRSNPNPEAFRAADSFRTWAVIERPSRRARLVFRPYARYSDMDFLQHFLPGKPLEENGQTSAGLITSYAVDGISLDWTAGVDLEWARGWLRETQENGITGSAFLAETRPVGRHYDYDVTQLSVSPWLNVEYALDPRTRLVAGARADWLQYDYDNRMSAGNAREDGSECGFGGCIYTRPADRTDSYSNVSPKLGFRRAIGEQTIYGNLLRGFRVPQATELYRLQRGQQVADLESVRVDNLEIGMRGERWMLDYDVAVFMMEKRHAIFRDAEGFNVSDGRTRHRGIEFDVGWRATDSLSLALHGTYARHRYAFDYFPDDGERFASGNDIDTAPHTLGSVLMQWMPSEDSRVELEYAHTGGYYLDAENRHRYPGHGLWHVRWGKVLGDFDLRVRINNLLDEEYAERADYAFGNYRYFPGWPRRVNVEVAFAF